MKPCLIVNGSFTKAGNFTARTSTGEQIHVSARQMESIGMTKQEDVKFPIFGFSDIMMRNFNDANGNLKEEKEPRLETLSIFKTEAERTSAFVLENTQAITLKKAIKDAYSTAGLTEEDIAKLAAIEL